MNQIWYATSPSTVRIWHSYLFCLLKNLLLLICIFTGAPTFLLYYFKFTLGYTTLFLMTSMFYSQTVKWDLIFSQQWRFTL